MTPHHWMKISAWIWFGAGVMLLRKGCGWIYASMPEVSMGYVGMWSGVAIVLGLLKGKFILAKTVHRLAGKLRALPVPITWRHVYDIRYVIVMAAMMSLGMVLRWLPIASLVRGAIDLAVGTALIVGFLISLRACR